MEDSKNIFDELEAAEIEGLLPFLDGEELSYLLAHIEPIRTSHDYGKISTALDLEQLQLADYPSLYSNTPQLIPLLKTIQNSGLYDQRELDFLTLRSLVTFTWPMPESKEHLEYMVTIEAALHATMLRMAKYIRKRHPERVAWLAIREEWD